MARRGDDEKPIPKKTRFYVCPLGDKGSLERNAQRNVRPIPYVHPDLSRSVNPDKYFQTYDEALIKKYYELVDEIKEIKARNPIQYEAIADSEKELITIYNELKAMGVTVQPYERYEGKETPTPDKPDAKQVLIDQRARFRTKVIPKAYMDPYIDALLDIWSTLLCDIERMKAHDPIPQEVLAEAEEELTKLKKTMKEAGIILYE
jgi:hypothetical protein